LLATGGSGYQIEKCFQFDFFRESIAVALSDGPNRALEVARNYGIPVIELPESDSTRLNASILEVADGRHVDYIISQNFTRIFRGELLDRYRNRIFNCHPSLIPAFRGFYDTRDTKRTYPARKIFERTLEFGSLIIGNTIHCVSELVDEGYPILVSSMSIPYDEDPALTRHRLFVREVKCLLQMVAWLNQERVIEDSRGRVIVKDAVFSKPEFSPNLEDQAIMAFDLPFPWQSES